MTTAKTMQDRHTFFYAAPDFLALILWTIRDFCAILLLHLILTTEMENITMKKKLFSMLLAAILLSGTVACNRTDTETTPSETQNNTETDETESVEVESKETGEEDFVSALPQADYAGANFYVDSANTLVGIDSATTINIAEELTGEIVNDALYNRDRYLEQQYNVVMQNTINETRDASVFQKGVLAGDTNFHVAFGDVGSYGAYIVQKGCCYPMNFVENVQLDRPYWNQAANKAMTIGTSVYYPTGAITPRFYGSVYIIMFNKDLAEDLGIENLYDAVQSGTWTIDKMFHLAQGALVDLNGDGKYDTDDQYGLVYEVLTPYALWIGADKTVVVNDNGNMRYAMDDEDLITLFDHLLSYLSDPSVTRDLGDAEISKLLYEGRTLFQNPCTFNLTEYREVEFSFGILPMPKENEEQENYISYGQPWVVYCPYVPITVTGAEREMTGMLLDAMAAYGHQYVRPAVFDNVIQLKTTRDEESAKIISSMFDNVSFELADNVSRSLGSLLGNLFTNKFGTMERASSWASIKEAAEADLQSMVATLAENEAKMQQ